MISLSIKVQASIEWHNCCEITIDDNKLEEAYSNFVKNQCGVVDDKCFSYLKSRKMLFEDFKRILIDEPKKECFEKTQDSKKLFEAKTFDFFVKLDTSKIDYFFEESFKDPSFYKVTIIPQSYDLKSSLWMENRIPSLFSDFTIANSRFNYLRSNFMDVKDLQKQYDKEYYNAKKICDEKVTTKEIPYENSEQYDVCMRTNTHFSKNFIDNYYFNILKSGYYVKALSVCEELLGFQNDENLINFPGQLNNNGCSDSEKINGCCPGYHKDIKFDVCCSKGFEAYKSEDGSILCGPAQLGPEIISVKIKLSKNKLLLDNQDSIIATLSYSARTPLGEIVPYANKNINGGIVARAKTSQFDFDVKQLSKKTDENGELKVKITLKKANIDSVGFDSNEKIKVNIYSLDQPDYEKTKTYFTLDFGKGIKINSVEQVSNGVAWQGTPIQLKVTVDDPLHEKKLYKFESKTSFRINGKNEDYVSFYTTKENEVPFTWFSPKISSEVKIDYTKRIATALYKMGLIALEDIGSEKLEKYISSTKPSEISNEFTKLNQIYDGMNKIVKVDIQANGAIDQGKSLVKKETETYQFAKKGINGLLWLEGTIGILGKPATPLLTTLKAGLTGVNEWYNLVEDLEKVAKSKKVTLKFPITVSVEGLQTKSKDSIKKEIPVQGFEMVMSQ